MDSLTNLRQRLALLDTMLNRMKTSHARLQNLKRCVFVLRQILKVQDGIQSPYGPVTTFIRFSVQ